MEFKILVTVPEPLNIVAKFKKEITFKNAEVLTYEDGETIDHQIWLMGHIFDIAKMLKKVVKNFDGEYYINSSIADFENCENEMDANEIISLLTQKQN
jgi:hypothetical protein